MKKGVHGLENPSTAIQKNLTRIEKPVHGNTKKSYTAKPTARKSVHGYIKKSFTAETKKCRRIGKPFYGYTKKPYTTEQKNLKQLGKTRLRLNKKAVHG